MRNSYVRSDKDPDPNAAEDGSENDSEQEENLAENNNKNLIEIKNRRGITGRPPLKRETGSQASASDADVKTEPPTSDDLTSSRDVKRRFVSSNTADSAVRSKRRRTQLTEDDSHDVKCSTSAKGPDLLRGETAFESEGTPSDAAGTSGLKTSFLAEIPSKLNGFRSMKRHRPAELFRKDLISAMKLADSEPLDEAEYLTISDPWRQEWERGVQVPVNPDVVPEASVRQIYDDGFKGSFKLNPRKFLHATQDANFQSGIHELTMVDQMAEQVCRYDLDDLDIAWLGRTNEELTLCGESEIHEYAMEKFVEEVENKCYEQLQGKIRAVEAAGIEFDDEIACNVCFALEGEDGNEMIFCDACDVCVHQACYGVHSIPEGDWLCRTCATGVQPQCVLCPKKGGAMKSTRSGSSWAHVACALWVPEVSIGDPEKMEPITNISNIPSQRWSLLCSVCKEKSGAPIQCSVKTCKTAFHVTCAFNQGFDMKTVVDESDDAVNLQAFCRKHSSESVKLKTRHRRAGRASSGSTSASSSTVKKTREEGAESEETEDDDFEDEMTEEEKDRLRKEKIRQCEEDFYILVKPEDILPSVQDYLAQWQLSLNLFQASLIFNFWKLKRRSNDNKPLLTPKLDEADALAKQQEDALVARMKMFMHLRQDLERVRNLCYMVNKREKLRRQWLQLRRDVFFSQLKVLEDKRLSLSKRERDAVIESHRMSPLGLSATMSSSLFVRLKRFGRLTPVPVTDSCGAAIYDYPYFWDKIKVGGDSGQHEDRRSPQKFSPFTGTSDAGSFDSEIGQSPCTSRDFGQSASRKLTQDIDVFEIDEVLSPGPSELKDSGVRTFDKDRGPLSVDPLQIPSDADPFCYDSSEDDACKTENESDKKSKTVDGKSTKGKLKKGASKTNDDFAEVGSGTSTATADDSSTIPICDLKDKSIGRPSQAPKSTDSQSNQASLESDISLSLPILTPSKDLTTPLKVEIALGPPTVPPPSSDQENIALEEREAPAPSELDSVASLISSPLPSDPLTFRSPKRQSPTFHGQTRKSSSNDDTQVPLKCSPPKNVVKLTLRPKQLSEEPDNALSSPKRLLKQVKSRTVSAPVGSAEDQDDSVEESDHLKFASVPKNGPVVTSSQEGVASVGASVTSPKQPDPLRVGAKSAALASTSLIRLERECHVQLVHADLTLRQRMSSGLKPAKDAQSEKIKPASTLSSQTSSSDESDVVFVVRNSPKKLRTRTSVRRILDDDDDDDESDDVDSDHRTDARRRQSSLSSTQRTGGRLHKPGRGRATLKKMTKTNSEEDRKWSHRRVNEEDDADWEMDEEDADSGPFRVSNMSVRGGIRRWDRRSTSVSRSPSPYDSHFSQSKKIKTPSTKRSSGRQKEQSEGSKSELGEPDQIDKSSKDVLAKFSDRQLKQLIQSAQRSKPIVLLEPLVELTPDNNGVQLLDVEVLPTETPKLAREMNLVQGSSVSENKNRTTPKLLFQSKFQCKKNKGETLPTVVIHRSTEKRKESINRTPSLTKTCSMVATLEGTEDLGKTGLAIRQKLREQRCAEMNEKGPEREKTSEASSTNAAPDMTTVSNPRFIAPKKNKLLPSIADAASVDIFQLALDTGTPLGKKLALPKQQRLASTSSANLPNKKKSMLSTTEMGTKLSPETTVIPTGAEAVGAPDAADRLTTDKAKRFNETSSASNRKALLMGKYKIPKRAFEDAGPDDAFEEKDVPLTQSTKNSTFSSDLDPKRSNVFNRFSSKEENWAKSTAYSASSTTCTSSFNSATLLTAATSEISLPSMCFNSPVNSRTASSSCISDTLISKPRIGVTEKEAIKPGNIFSMLQRKVSTEATEPVESKPSVSVAAADTIVAVAEASSSVQDLPPIDVAPPTLRTSFNLFSAVRAVRGRVHKLAAKDESPRPFSQSEFFVRSLSTQAEIVTSTTDEGVSSSRGSSSPKVSSSAPEMPSPDSMATGLFTPRHDDVDEGCFSPIEDDTKDPEEDPDGAEILRRFSGDDPLGLKKEPLPLSSSDSSRSEAVPPVTAEPYRRVHDRGSRKEPGEAENLPTLPLIENASSRRAPTKWGPSKEEDSSLTHLWPAYHDGTRKSFLPHPSDEVYEDQATWDSSHEVSCQIPRRESILYRACNVKEAEVVKEDQDDEEPDEAERDEIERNERDLERLMEEKRKLERMLLEQEEGELPEDDHINKDNENVDDTFEDEDTSPKKRGSSSPDDSNRLPKAYRDCANSPIEERSSLDRTSHVIVQGRRASAEDYDYNPRKSRGEESDYHYDWRNENDDQFYRRRHDSFQSLDRSQPNRHGSWRDLTYDDDSEYDYSRRRCDEEWTRRELPPSRREERSPPDRRRWGVEEDYSREDRRGMPSTSPRRTTFSLRSESAQYYDSLDDKSERTPAFSKDYDHGKSRSVSPSLAADTSASSKKYSLEEADVDEQKYRQPKERQQSEESYRRDGSWGGEKEELSAENSSSDCASIREADEQIYRHSNDRQQVDESYRQDGVWGVEVDEFSAENSSSSDYPSLRGIPSMRRGAPMTSAHFCHQYPSHLPPPRFGYQTIRPRPPMPLRPPRPLRPPQRYPLPFVPRFGSRRGHHPRHHLAPLRGRARGIRGGAPPRHVYSPITTYFAPR